MRFLGSSRGLFLHLMVHQRQKMEAWMPAERCRTGELSGVMMHFLFPFAPLMT